MIKNLSKRIFFHWPKAWINYWESRSLSQQFALMSSIVLLGGMITIGAWVAEKIESSVTHNTAVATALYFNSFVAPNAQELVNQNRLSPDQQSSLEGLFKNTELGARIATFKIWKPGGLVVYSSRKSIIGKYFPETENLRLAWAGNISAEFDELVDEENAEERADGGPFLEMYSPIRESLTGRIIAVAEFYQEAAMLKSELFQAQFESWALVFLVTIIMLSLLFLIVRRGNRTIESQKIALKNRVFELSDLRNRLKNASRRSTELNERFLRRVGSDLHDGPAQLLGLALLRLNEIRRLVEEVPDLPTSKIENISTIQNALNDALTDIRNISTGLVLPELDGLTLKEILTKAVSTHEYRTRASVDLSFKELPTYIGKSVQICLYRLVQEGLNNAENHASGASCLVTAQYTGDSFEVSVSDKGPGFDLSALSTSSVGLGLPGLRERIESVGGQFKIESFPGQGTQLTAIFSTPDLDDCLAV
jgi:signal transduction histidine kinase